jgi:peptidyl-prolyl cis-trans isomerase D
MLSLMRKNAGTWMIKILLGAIVIVFVFWGVGSYTSRRAGRVALVNGEPISVEEFRRTYDNLLDQTRRRFGNALNDEMIKNLKLKHQALNQLIDQRLLLDEAARLKIRVDDQELADAIKNLPVFQVNGAFNDRRYQSVLGQLRMSPEDFELYQRQAMIVAKLRDFVTGMVKVSGQEARWWYDWRNAKVSVEYVVFDPASYKDITPSEAQIKAFYDQHKDQYKTPPRRKIRYIFFDPAKAASSVKVSEDELRDYYETHPKEFETPKSVEARHILIKVAPEASEEAVQDARKKIEGILKQIREGKDFAEMAKKYSEGPTAQKGGYLGSFTRDSMVKPFADKAFTMKAGEVSEPVRTQFGWHLIKVEKVKEASKKTLEQATPEILKKLRAERAKAEAYDLAEEVFESSGEQDDLTKVAEQRQMKAVTTGFFSAQEPIKGIKSSRKVAEEAFKLPPMEISDVLETDEGYYLIQVVEKQPGKIPALDEIREKVKADLVRDLQAKAAEKDAQAFLAAVRKGKTMAEESTRLKLKVATSEPFARGGAIPGIGYEPQLAAAAFKLSPKEPFPEKAFKGRSGFYVIRLDKRIAPDGKNFAEQEPTIRAQLVQEKKNKVFRGLLAQLREKAEINIEESVLD